MNQIAYQLTSFVSLSSVPAYPPRNVQKYVHLVFIQSETSEAIGMPSPASVSVGENTPKRSGRVPMQASEELPRPRRKGWTPAVHLVRACRISTVQRVFINTRADKLRLKVTHCPVFAEAKC